MQESHAFQLSRTQRVHGIDVMGTDVARFSHKLQTGEPVTVAIIGASVAQNAGCIDQPGRRCMNYNGRTGNVTLSWGEPRTRPFKGFLVRWFEWMNATWPHSRHRLLNFGRDAQPIQRLLPCIYAYVPSDVDIIFLEVGSMYMWFDAVSVEATVRQLALLRPRPAIAFVTVALWCRCIPYCRNTPAYGVSNLPARKEQNLLRPEDPMQDHLDTALATICQTYSCSSLSMRRALNASVYAKHPGFTIPELARDCLHPVHGSRGVDYVTDVLVHWTKHAVAARAQIDPALSMPATQLPRPVWRAAPRVAQRPAVCLDLERLGSRGTSNGQRLLTVPWHTTRCEGNMPASTSDGCGAEQSLTSACAARLSGTRVCNDWDTSVECPSAWPMPGFMPPPVWFFCTHSLGAGLQRREEAQRKESPGVVALQPGAQLFLPLELPFASNSSLVSISVSHLVSYKGMGQAALRCVSGCACETQQIDAHNATLGYSLFASHTFQAVTTTKACMLLITLRNATSSGGTKFKVRDVQAWAL